jgi:hypothetical protein
MTSKDTALTAHSQMERVTGIEPALSAWESHGFGLFWALTWAFAQP